MKRMLTLLLLAGCATSDGGKGTATDPFEQTPWVGPLAPFCEMTELGRVQLPGEYKTGVAVRGDHAFVTWGGNDWVQGLEVIDISDPSAPKVVGHAELGDWWPLRVRVHGDLAVVTHQWDGFYVFDVSQPTAPLLLANVRPNLDEDSGYGWRVSDVAFHGQHLVVSGVQLWVYDLSDPSAPELVGEVTNDQDDPALAFGTTEEIALDGDIAYVSELDGGIAVFDLTDPRRPQVLATVDWPGALWSIAAREGTVFATDLEFGVRTADVTDPTQPVRLDTITTSGEPYASALSGDRLFVGANLSGVFGFDVSDPAHLRWDSYAVVDEGAGGGGFGVLDGDGPWGMAVTDSGLLVAVTKPDLRILQDCDPTANAAR